MIADTNPSADGRALAWSLRQLGTPPGNAPEIYTAAFLQRMADEDFVPPPRLREAWECAVRGGSNGGPVSRLLESNAKAELGGRIEEFAQQFFNLPPEQRSAQWERLNADATSWPRLKSRLRQLQPGIAVVFTPLSTLNLREARLIQFIRELFPLPLEQRAPRWRQMLRDNFDGDIRPWATAVKRLRKRHRAVAALAPELLMQLATWRRRAKAVSRNRQRRTDATMKTRSLGVGSLRHMGRLFKIAIPFALLVVWLILWGSPRDQYGPHFDRPPNAPLDPHIVRFIEQPKQNNAPFFVETPAPSSHARPRDSQFPIGPGKPSGDVPASKSTELLIPSANPHPQLSPEAPAAPSR